MTRQFIARLTAKFRRRAFCICEPGAKLYPEARIYNNQGSDQKISIGMCSQIRGELLTFGHGGKISIGKQCYVGSGTRIWSGQSIEVGDYVLIAHNVTIIDNLSHPLNHLERRAHFSEITKSGHPKDIDLGDRPIKIEDDAWIGAHAIILRGVTIGTRSIVSAGSVVRSDVPPDTIVAGNPANVVRTNSQNNF
jgi:acetyltransferase-like isoleucine patch superfamily enzyme